jgi:hypothetical protein
MNTHFQAVSAVFLMVLIAATDGCSYSPVARAPGPGDFTERDVQKFITPGRPFEEITNRFGQPTLINTNGQYLIWQFQSGLPETRPVKTEVILGEKGYVFAAFQLWTTNGRAARWRVSCWEKIGK